MKYFVTGAAGFIGSNYIRWLLANTDHTVTVFDKLTYAGNFESINDLVEAPDHRCSFVKGDICDRDAVETVLPGHNVVVHFAAESHVDRSIEDADAFVHTNVFGTNVLCDVARRSDIERFVVSETGSIGKVRIYLKPLCLLKADTLSIKCNRGINVTDHHTDIDRCFWK